VANKQISQHPDSRVRGEGEHRMGLGQSNGPVLARGDVNIITNLCKKKTRIVECSSSWGKIEPNVFS
jgi:hypothetical protein